MDPEDMFEAAFLSGGGEVVELLVSGLALLVVVGVLVGLLVTVDPSAMTAVLVLVLVLSSAAVGGVVGMKVERFRSKLH